MSDRADRDLVSGWYPRSRTDRTEAAVWYGALNDDTGSIEPTEDRAERRRLRTKRIALSACALVLVCAGLLSLLRPALRASAPAETAQKSEAPSSSDSSDSGGYEDFREYFANYYTGSAYVDIPRTETGLGVTVDLAPAEGEELSLQEIYDKVSPAVVGITATLEGAEYSWGTGVLFTPDGYIITNTHIVSGCDGARVTLLSGEEYEALLVGYDETSDIAVLKVDGEDLPWAEFGVSDALRVGDEAIAIGNPLGEQYAGTMTNGIISAISRNVRNNGHTMTLLQTNAALNEGNSGGPLVNAWGQVVGITNMKIMSSYTATVEGIGFAIPSSVVKQVADQILALGDVQGEPTIGITAGPVSVEAMALYGLPAGVYVSSVDEGSDAWTQGLREGDVILRVNGTEVSSVPEVNAIKDEFQVGDTLTLTVYRDGETFDMDIRLVDRMDLK